MNRITRIAVAFGLIVAMSGALAGTAAAQDPAITIDPPAVPAAGTYDFTMVGTDFPSSPIVLLCAVPGSGDAADVDAGSCDVSNPFQFAVSGDDFSDGGFTVTFSFEIPDGGVGVYATEPAEGGANAAAIIEVDPTVVLATTGVESGLLAIIGLAVVAGGAMVVGTTRRRA
jgi:hypothetical protein